MPPAPQRPDSLAGTSATRSRSAGAWAIVALALALATAASARAQIVNGGGASILVFPLVVADGERDTLIEISSTVHLLTLLRCRYVSDPAVAAGDWFDLTLTGQQPTHWEASRGRTVDPNDGVCGPPGGGSLDCDGSGFDPGRIPAVAPPFAGALVCVELDRSGAPWSGNGLRGAASLMNVAGGDVSRYAAIGLSGFSSNDGDGVLCLGGAPSERCPHGAEYGACPDVWHLAHLADGAPDPIAGESVTVHTELALLSCSLGASSRVQILVTNELEQRFSAFVDVDGWARRSLGELSVIFRFDTAGSAHLLTDARPASGSAGIMLLSESHRRDGAAPIGGATTAAAQSTGADGSADVINLGED